MKVTMVYPDRYEIFTSHESSVSVLRVRQVFDGGLLRSKPDEVKAPSCGAVYFDLTQVSAQSKALHEGMSLRSAFETLHEESGLYSVQLDRKVIWRYGGEPCGDYEVA